MLRVAFDPAKGVVEVRGESPDRLWLFHLNCALGVASIELGGNTFDVRPLTWRQKRMLARYSSLGARFVECQFLQLSAGESRIPDGEEDREALLALATWMNSPSGCAATDFDSALLTRVELDVCSALQLRPGDLDQREAVDVEAVWQSLARDWETEPELAPAAIAVSNARPTTTLAGAAHRIRVIPDREPATAPAGSGQHGTPDVQIAPPSTVMTTIPSVAFSTGASNESTRDPSAMQPPETRAKDSALHHSEQPSESELPSESGLRSELPAGSPRSTVRPLGEHAFRWVGGRKKAASISSGRPARVAAASAPPAGTPDAPLAVSQTPVPQAALLRTHAMPVAAGSQPVITSAAVLNAEPATVPVPLALTVPRPPREIDFDVLFDELGERLEQAAAELGIGLGA